MISRRAFFVGVGGGAGIAPFRADEIVRGTVHWWHRDLGYGGIKLDDGRWAWCWLRKRGWASDIPDGTDLFIAGNELRFIGRNIGDGRWRVHRVVLDVVGPVARLTHGAIHTTGYSTEIHAALDI